jgi:hypothetical protein
VGFVSSNGERKPPRPRIELLGSPEPEEAAAVVAAVERFLAETAPAPERSQPVAPWQRAALLEGIRTKEGFASPWGEPRTWGERHSHRS